MHKNNIILSMKKILTYLLFLCVIISDTSGQPLKGQQQGTQTPDLLIATGTNNIDLIYRVNGRDGRLYQSYLGSRLDDISVLSQSKGMQVTWPMPLSVLIIFLNRQ